MYDSHLSSVRVENAVTATLIAILVAGLLMKVIASGA